MLLFLGNLTGYAQLCGFAPGEGCSNTNYDNAFLKTLIYNNPATIEYDNFVSTYHSSIVRTSSGGFKVWGEGMANDGISNVLSPQDLNATNYPALGSAKVYKVTGASDGSQSTTPVTSNAQFVALTSDGLYAWGVTAIVLNATIKSTGTFGKIAVNGKADGLPPNVSPGDVKMMTAGSNRTLVIVTCSGDVWVLAADAPTRGNGSTGSSTVWSRVQTTATTFLTDVIAARTNGSGNAIIALKSDGTLWTWGYSYLGNGTAIASRTMATQMTAPAGTPKMIGMVVDGPLSAKPSAYYVLMTDGNLYAMGTGGTGGSNLMGNWSGASQTSWVQPRYTSASGPVMNNIAWISPGASDERAVAINVLTTSGSLYAWGNNSKSMIGAGGGLNSNPTMPAGIVSTDKIIAVQTGGHTTMLIKECSTNFGYVGHRINGSMGNGSAVDTQEDSYTFNTAPLEICSATPVDLTSPTPTACGVSTMQLAGSPAGGSYTVTSGPATVSNTGLLTFTGDGNVTVQYTSPSSCGGGTLTKSITIPVTQNIVNANAGSNQFLLGANQTILAGNNPSPSTGMWTLLTKPATATDPVIVTPSAYNTQVTGLTAGAYTFRWTVTTGTCTSTSDLTVNVINAAAGGVSGADFWIKSDDAGAIATAWKDNSANADHIPNVGGMILSPADRAHNFYPYTTGYTTSKFFYNNASAMNLTNGELPNTNTSIFSAVRPTTAGAGGRITGIDDDATYAAEPGVSITSAGKPRQYEFFNTTTSTDFSTTTFNIGQSNIFSAIADNTVANGGTSSIAGGEKRLGLNGSYQSFSGFGATNKFQIYGRNLRVGHAAWDVNGAFPGDIMEVIWYKRTLIANEQSRVNAYLAVKNGVTLAENYLTSTSSVVWDMLINAGYTNNIFGIARDNASALHQKQSGSVNAGQKLVVSTTGFADNNAANSTGIANDLQFLMTGDNGLYQGLKIPFSYTAGSNGVTNYRFEAIWKVQNSGNVGTVTVAWPKGVKNLYLVQSPDAVFDGTDTFTPMATEVIVNGLVYNTANVTLANGQFFTFAGFGNAPGGVANGLSYWYRADKNAANTGVATDVTGWTDVWNGTTVAQLGTNVLPKYVLGASNYFNFNPGINFTLGTQTLGNNTVRTLTSLNYDVFTLTKEGLASGGTNPRLFSVGMDNTTTGITNWDAFGIWPTGQIERRVYNGSTNYPSVSPAYSTTIPSIMYYRNTDIATVKGLNGALMSTSVAYSSIGYQYGGHMFGNTVFSSNGSDNAGFTGHIGETIVYGGGTLSNVERRQVDSYLAIKYGITLGQLSTAGANNLYDYTNADGATVWSRTLNAVYNNNVFGVAREDIGLFEQKVSTSVNAGTILTVATSNDFVSPNNTASRTSFANDKTYFLLGDNNDVTTTLSSITVNGFKGGMRIPRVWLAQRTNTSGAMYFAADLSAYGAGFWSGDQVKMIIADDAAFTSNVVSVPGTYDATIGKWVHSYNFGSGNANRYITYAALDDVACTTGCNTNTYLNATDPNTIEYDNIIASEIVTIVKQKDGSFYIWGPSTSPNVDINSITLDLLTPTKIDPATSLPGQGSGFNYTGTPLKATTSGGSTNAHILLTTDGLYTWGGSLLPYGLRNPVGSKFGKQSVNGKADGLPPGISPTNVKMMVANQTSLTITTCSGAVWNFNSGGYYGDGAPVSTANNGIWHRVMRSPTQSLDNVVAVRGIVNTKFALTSDGKLYTWGYNTFHNDNTAAAVSDYATEISVPAGITPKMIGMTEGVNEGESSYYLLATNGKLYAMGYNAQRQLGDGTTTLRRNWVEIIATSGSNTLGGNIAWISPAEHTNDYPSVNVLTTDGKQWGWGYNLYQQLGGVSDGNGIAPTYMPGNGTGANQLGLNDKVVAVADGGNHVINFKASSTSFGFIGTNVRGSMGDGSNVASTNMNKYTYVSPLDLCGFLAPVCTQPGLFDAAGLPSTTGISDLAGFTGGATGWPANVPNGHVVIESKNKGFVITRVSSSAAILNPVEGMLIYDIAAGCVKLYNGTVWNCLAKDCL